MSTVGNYWTRQTKINCAPQAEKKSEIEANIPKSIQMSAKIYGRHMNSEGLHSQLQKSTAQNETS